MSHPEMRMSRSCSKNSQWESVFKSVNLTVWPRDSTRGTPGWRCTTDSIEKLIEVAVSRKELSEAERLFAVWLGHPSAQQIWMDQRPSLLASTIPGPYTSATPSSFIRPASSFSAGRDQTPAVGPLLEFPGVHLWSLPVNAPSRPRTHCSTRVPWGQWEASQWRLRQRCRKPHGIVRTFRRSRTKKGAQVKAPNSITDYMALMSRHLLPSCSPSTFGVRQGFSYGTRSGRGYTSGLLWETQVIVITEVLDIHACDPKPPEGGLGNPGNVKSRRLLFYEKSYFPSAVDHIREKGVGGCTKTIRLTVRETAFPNAKWEVNVICNMVTNQCHYIYNIIYLYLIWT